MFEDFLVVPGENGLLEAAIEAAEIDIEEHGNSADLAGFTEVEKVVFKELVAFHGVAVPILTAVEKWGQSPFGDSPHFSTTNPPPKSPKILHLRHWDTLSRLGLGRVVTT